MDDASDSDRDEIDILRVAHGEARRTVDNQTQTLNDIDAKAARILRLNLVILGIILTGLSVATPTENGGAALIAYDDLVNWYNIGGIVFLLLSTGVAAVTYTASSLRAGMGPADLVNMLDNDYSDRENLEGLVESYSGWIQYNFKVNAKNAPLGTLTLLLLIVAMTALSLGVKKAATGVIEWWLLLAVVLLFGAVVYATGIIGQVQRWRRVR